MPYLYLSNNTEYVTIMELHKMFSFNDFVTWKNPLINANLFIFVIVPGPDGMSGVMKGSLYSTCFCKNNSIGTMKIDDSSFKVFMQLYSGMLKLNLFQVDFLNLVLGKGGSKSASTVSFDWKPLEACNFAQCKFNLIKIELS